MGEETVDGGFRLAAVFDRVDPVTGPGFAPDRPRLEPAEREALARYLDAGEAVLLTPVLMDDVLDPQRRGEVPMGYRTDGRWVWTDTVTYYLVEYGLAPEAGLLAHLRAQGGAPCPPVDPEAVERAVAFVLTPPGEDSEPVWTIGS
ncbi:hypothetical protein [Kitasatospora sp. NPDC101183]|uniref:hypothetical protein n=1 Tax=Kitasatospora sp. NPDC101183 TaxID=3364100 RepID=UPI0037F44DE6